MTNFEKWKQELAMIDYKDTHCKYFKHCLGCVFNQSEKCTFEKWASAETSVEASDD